MAVDELSDEEPRLGDYLSTLKRQKWVIALVTATFVAAGGAWVAVSPIQYESSTTVRVDSGEVSGDEASADLETEKFVVTSSEVAEVVRTELGLSSVSVEALVEQVSVSILPNTELLVITFEDEDPAGARAGAQAFAEAYLRVSLRQASARLAEARGQLLEELRVLSSQKKAAEARLSQSAPGSPERAEARADIQAILAQIDGVRTRMSAVVGDVGSATILDPASEASSSSSLRFGILLTALFLGLLLGSVIALARGALVKRPISRREVEQLLGVPVLAMIPRTKRARAGARPVVESQPESVAAEGYRSALTVLPRLLGDETAVIGVTSVRPGEGKTTVAANLALGLAQARRRVTLVSGDLRQPRLHEVLGASDTPGLLDLIEAPELGLDGVVVEVNPFLKLLPSGSPRPFTLDRPAEKRVTRIAQVLRSNSDVVLVDMSPLIVSEALFFAALADGVLFVIDAESASVDMIVEARDRIARSRGRILGAIVLFRPSAQLGADLRSVYGATESYLRSSKSKVRKRKRKRERKRDRRIGAEDAPRTSDQRQQDSGVEASLNSRTR